MPRSEQSVLTLPERDAVGILESQHSTRLPDFIPVRVGRMLETPFSFYRGAAAVMAHDLADSRVTGHMLIASGDAHLANFGLFASPERRLIFDLNDFDEANPAPWEWDVKTPRRECLVERAEQFAHRGTMPHRSADLRSQLSPGAQGVCTTTP